MRVHSPNVFQRSPALVCALISYVLLPISASAAGLEDQNEKVRKDNNCRELHSAAIGAYLGRGISGAEDLLTLGTPADCRDPDDADLNNTTALMAASEVGNLDMVRVLIENGADVNAHDKKGWTPLRIAMDSFDHLTERLTPKSAIPEVRKKLSAVIDFLRSHGAALQ